MDLRLSKWWTKNTLRRKINKRRKRRKIRRKTKRAMVNLRSLTTI
jgi:hypothetical protein